MRKCIKCGEEVNTKTNDFGYTVFKIPFINLVLKKYNFQHSNCKEPNESYNEYLKDSPSSSFKN